MNRTSNQLHRALWPVLLFISTVALCLCLLEAPLDMRGAVRFVRPYHYLGTVLTVLGTILVFWPLYRCIGWLRRRGAFVVSILFLLLLFTAWAFTLPLGDRIAIHHQRLDPTQQYYLPEPGFGWFYGDDSGMGAWPMQLAYLFYALKYPWLPAIFLAFYPIFFYLQRNSSEPGNA